MEKVINRNKGDIHIFIPGKTVKALYFKNYQDDINDVMGCITEMIGYHVIFKNKSYIYSKEYDDRINKISSIFKKVLEKLQYTYDLSSAFINLFQELKKYYYNNIKIFKKNDIEEEFYYLTVDKIIDDLTINVLKMIEDKQWHSLKDNNKNLRISNISHDLKTPINIILCSNQMLSSLKNSDKSIVKYNGIIKNNCFKLLRMVDNIIDAVKEDNGELTLNSYNIDIVPLITDLAKTVNDYIKSKEIDFSFVCSLKSRVISADCEKIERIILNLLSNAIKFTQPGGSITLKLDSDKEYIRISIKDTGDGIPKDKQKHIFDRFYQINKDDGYRGAGIGLSLVKSFVDLMKGKIKVSSDIGKGTEFVIYIPDMTDSSNEYLSYDNYYNNHVLIMNKEFSEL